MMHKALTILTLALLTVISARSEGSDSLQVLIQAISRTYP